jgi:hypothetical protein
LIVGSRKQSRTDKLGALRIDRRLGTLRDPLQEAAGSFALSPQA